MDKYYYSDRTISNVRDRSKVLHRVGGPAFEGIFGTKEWYENGVKHRLGGPAVEWATGQKEWWINGKEVTEQEHNDEIAERILLSGGDLTGQD